MDKPKIVRIIMHTGPFKALIWLYGKLPARLLSICEVHVYNAEIKLFGAWRLVPIPYITKRKATCSTLK